MNYQEAKIEQIALQMNEMKSAGKSTVLFLGAGVSKTANIPLADEMVKTLKTTTPYKERIEIRCQDIKDIDYGKCMNELTPQQRRNFLNSCINGCKINLSYIFISSLVKNGLVDCVLTTNFDPLTVKTLNLFNNFPSIYDIATAKQFIPETISFPAVFYLHGQNNGFRILNTEEELKEPLKSIEDTFKFLFKDKTIIIVGYSGKNDKVFEKLSEFTEYSNDLYWIGYKENPPETFIVEKILNPQNKSGYFVKGYDSDSFFQTLHSKLDLKVPNFIKSPFTHIKNLYDDHFGNITITESKEIDLFDIAKKEIAIAIKYIENQNDISGLISDLEFLKEEKDLVEDTKELYLSQKYDNIDSLLYRVKESSKYEAKEYLAYCFINRGKDFYSKKNYENAIEDFDKAIELNPEDPDAWSNKGIILKNLKKFDEAIICYDKAIKLNPNYAKPWNNKGNAFLYLGKNEDAFNCYDKAIELNPDFHEAWNNKGNLLKKLGINIDAIKCYRIVIAKKHDYIDAYFNLAELYITINDYKNAMIEINQAIKYSVDDVDFAQTLYLQCINETLLDNNTDEIYKRFEDICNKDFKTDWSFSELENWLVKTKMNNEKKEFIYKIIDMLKEHQ